MTSCLEVFHSCGEVNGFDLQRDDTYDTLEPAPSFVTEQPQPLDVETETGTEDFLQLCKDAINNLAASYQAILLNEEKTEQHRVENKRIKEQISKGEVELQLLESLLEISYQVNRDFEEFDNQNVQHQHNIGMAVFYLQRYILNQHGMDTQTSNLNDITDPLRQHFLNEGTKTLLDQVHAKNVCTQCNTQLRDIHLIKRCDGRGLENCTCSEEDYPICFACFSNDVLEQFAAHITSILSGAEDAEFACRVKCPVCERSICPFDIRYYVFPQTSENPEIPTDLFHVMYSLIAEMKKGYGCFAETLNNQKEILKYIQSAEERSSKKKRKPNSDNQQVSDKKGGGRRCTNCGLRGHYTPCCQAPCKLCGADYKVHKYPQCPKLQTTPSKSDQVSMGELEEVISNGTVFFNI